MRLSAPTAAVRRRARQPIAIALLVLAWATCSAGCAFGPQALERTHARFNEAVIRVTDEQLLENIVRLRYSDNPGRLDIASIASQYEVGGSIEARPFMTSEGVNIATPVGPFGVFTRILPFAGVSGTNRPTMSLVPLDDSDNIRSLFQPSTLDGVVFLTETSWPLSTVFRLWLESMNRLPNAPTLSGPDRGLTSEHQEFLKAVTLMQALHDAGHLRFNRQEKIVDLGSPLPDGTVSPANVIEAARNGMEYRQAEDKTWTLTRRDRKLTMKLAPSALGCSEAVDLVRTLNLQPGLTEYDVVIGGPSFPQSHPAEPLDKLYMFPRSTAQALFYISKGVEVPEDDVRRGLVRPGANDSLPALVDLFRVASSRQHGRPKCASVAVRYRDCWFYIDDRDVDSKTTFGLMKMMAQLNLIATKKGGPALTLPVGR